MSNRGRDALAERYAQHGGLDSEVAARRAREVADRADGRVTEEKQRRDAERRRRAERKKTEQG